MRHCQSVRILGTFSLIIFLVVCGLPLGEATGANASDAHHDEEASYNGNGEHTNTGVEIADPLEPVNRVFFFFNDKLYFWVMKPIATVYRTFLPPGVRQCVSNAFSNIRMPIRFANNLFQGDGWSAMVELERFLVNSTLGLAGFFDVAKRHFDLPSHDEDFGQTLAVYGVGDGFYIVWPFVGPSTIRDSVGGAVDVAMDPLTYLVPSIPMKAEIAAGEKTNAVSLRIGEYEDLKRAAMDPYVAVRDAYLQHRQKKIRE